MITIYIPGLALRSYEYRRGDSQIIHDDTGHAIVIDGGESDLYLKLFSYCKSHGITHVTFILTHWHIDHDTGLKAFLEVSGICVDIIYLPPEAELAGLQEQGVSEDRARAKRRVSLAKSLGKTMISPAAGKDYWITVGDIRCLLWRRKANKGDQNDREINNTSMQAYFPDLYYLTGGDMIDKNDFLSTHKNLKVVVYKGYHHGNGDGENDTKTIKNMGAQLYWYNDFEPKGAAIGSTDFSKWGAGKAKKIIPTVIRTDSDIVMVAAHKKLTVQKGSSRWTYDIPYNGKGGEGWQHSEKGWWYQFEDGTFAVGWNQLVKDGATNWFCFNSSGLMITGWYYDQGFQKWYYLDPDDGHMYKNGSIKVEGLWYYLDGYGQMRTGWYDPGDGNRYLEPEAGKNQGHMYVNCEAEIDGKKYKFDGWGKVTEIIDEQPPTPPKTVNKPEIIANKNFKGYNVSARTTSPKYIVMHYTGAAGTAANNISYFNSANRNASADFFIGHDGDIREFNPNIPKKYTWHCGGSIESSHHPHNGICTNKNSIGVEMCTKKVDGKWTFNEKTLDAAARLVTWLMQEYDIPYSNVIRHYDVTGKNCPGVPGWAATGGETEWNKWKGRLVETVETPPIYRVRKTWEDAKSQIGAFTKLENARAYAAEQPGYFVFNDKGEKV